MNLGAGPADCVTYTRRAAQQGQYVTCGPSPFPVGIDRNEHWLFIGSRVYHPSGPNCLDEGFGVICELRECKTLFCRLDNGKVIEDFASNYIKEKK